MSSASAIIPSTVWKGTIDHTPINARHLVGFWARRAYPAGGDFSYTNRPLFIKSVVSERCFLGPVVNVIDSCGESFSIDSDSIVNWALYWTQISLQDDPMKFLENQVVQIIKDDKVANACKTAIKNLTKIFEQLREKEIYSWPFVKKSPPPLPDSAPLKALADWCEKNCPEAVADVQVLRSFGDLEITKKNYIPIPLT